MLPKLAGALTYIWSTSLTVSPLGLGTSNLWHSSRQSYCGLCGLLMMPASACCSSYHYDLLLNPLRLVKAAAFPLGQSPSQGPLHPPTPPPHWGPVRSVPSWLLRSIPVLGWTAH